MIENQPIGIFDSGVGGLSILESIRQTLPNEQLIYVADAANAPYGKQSDAQIVDHSLRVCRFLIAQNVKAIVVACNTATTIAISAIRATTNIPVIGVEPAIKPAVEQSKTGVVGVLATAGTLQSTQFEKLSNLYGKNIEGREIELITQPCNGLVERVEAGDIDGPIVTQLLEQHLQPLLKRNVDTLVLGCTHYPFLIETISQITGSAVAIIHPGEAVARQLEKRIGQESQLRVKTDQPSIQFFSSEVTERYRFRFEALLKQSITLQSINLPLHQS
ncbi:MAG: glutamate racemase [Pseudomonadales bacterium]|nr:glutamate racemase [Pseudomonadales bacterium]